MTLGVTSDGGVLLNDFADLLLVVRPWWRFVADDERKLSSKLLSAELRILFFSRLPCLSGGAPRYMSLYVMPADCRRRDRFCATPLTSPLGETAIVCRGRRSVV